MQKKLALNALAPPFDIKALEVLEKINCPFYKVSSFEMTDLELISEIAKTKKYDNFNWLSFSERN